MAYNILVVDDSATTRTIIKRTIQMAQLDVATIFEAGNGKEGLAAVSANKVDLVLADLHMPEMDGVEMTRQLLANQATKHVPVIIVSAEPNAEKVAALKAQGARGHLRKPFTPESLRDLIVNTLEARNAA